jgi:hypothetical protein
VWRLNTDVSHWRAFHVKMGVFCEWVLLLFTVCARVKILPAPGYSVLLHAENPRALSCLTSVSFDSDAPRLVGAKRYSFDSEGIPCSAGMSATMTACVAFFCRLDYMHCRVDILSMPRLLCFCHNLSSLLLRRPLLRVLQVSLRSFRFLPVRQWRTEIKTCERPVQTAV